MTAPFRRVTMLALLGLAACGGSDEPAEEAAPRPAWALATPVCEHLGLTELQSFTGRTYQEGQVAMDQPGTHRCVWRPTDGEPGAITYTVHPGVTNERQEEYTRLPGMEEVADGLGDRTWWSDDVQTYVVRHHDQLFVVGFDTHDGSHAAQARRMVERAMER